jgi:hypothetical protein
LRKATISFVMSVRMEQLCFHWADFHEIWYLSIFRKSVQKIQFWLKCNNNNRYFTRRLKCIFLYLAQFFSEWEMFQTTVVEKIKTHILCSVTFFFFENRTVCEIMWENIVERDRPQMTIWRMRTACCATKATNTLRICNIYCFSPATIGARWRLIVTLYVRCLYGPVWACPVFRLKFTSGSELGEKKEKVYLSSVMMKIPDHVYVLG